MTANDAEPSLNGEPISRDAGRREVIALARPAWVEPVIDAIIVAILALASLAAAWSGYQAARWGGVQATSYSQASARRIESTRAFTYANQQTIVDVMTFTNYVNATVEGNEELATFYEQRVRVEFRPAFEAWLATDPWENPHVFSSPFQLPEYLPGELVRADQLETEAGVLFDQGKDANQQADDYVLNTVFLAVVLFFAGIAPRIRWVPARITLISLSLVMLAFGLVNIATYPIQ